MARQILILENLVLAQATGPPQAEGDFVPEHGGTKKSQAGQQQTRRSRRMTPGQRVGHRDA